MSGTLKGGIKARDKNLASNPDFYKKIGKMGGSVSHRESRYFYMHPEIAAVVGSRGGVISKREWTADQRLAQSKALRARAERKKWLAEYGNEEVKKRWWKR